MCETTRKRMCTEEREGERMRQRNEIVESRRWEQARRVRADVLRRCVRAKRVVGGGE